MYRRFLGDSFGSAAVRFLGANLAPSKQTNWQEALCPLLARVGHSLAQRVKHGTKHLSLMRPREA